MQSYTQPHKCTAHSKWESSPWKENDKQTSPGMTAVERKGRRSPCMINVTFMVWDTPMSQPGSAALAESKLLMGCRLLLAYDSVPASPGQKG